MDEFTEKQIESLAENNSEANPDLSKVLYTYLAFHAAGAIPELMEALDQMIIVMLDKCKAEVKRRKGNE